MAIVPWRQGSKGVPGKNQRELGGRAIWKLAVDCARASAIPLTIVTSDAFTAFACIQRGLNVRRENDTWVDVTHKTPDWSVYHLPRPTELASDTAPMLAVVQHALAQIPGPDEQIICLLQPTAVFRTPAHIRRAIALLEERQVEWDNQQADSVVSVVPVPLTHSPDMVCYVGPYDYVVPWLEGWAPADDCERRPGWDGIPTRRQDVRPAYKRDGTVYAFRRSTVAKYGNIYGRDVRPLILDPSETCELDTEADWEAVTRRWEAQHARP